MVGQGLSRARPSRSLTIRVGRPTLVDRYFERGIVSDVFLMVAGAALTALLAQIEVPLWSVPATGQTLGVLIAGATLGAVRGAGAMMVYLAFAAAGLPVLAGGASGAEHLAGPTAGYLVAFVAAAALAGWASQRSWNRGPLRVFLSLLAASVLMLIAGAAWLFASGWVGMQDAVVGGALILLPGSLLKTVLATGVVVLGWRFVETDEQRRARNHIALRD